MNILLTGVGAPGTRGTLYALKNNPDHVKIKVTGVDIKSDVVGKYWVERFYEVPAPESDDYVDRINEICSKESIDVVIPQTTRETMKFSKTFDEIKSKVTVASSEAIQKANNKHELLKVCDNLGIPFPTYRLVRSLDDLIDAAEELGYPGKAVVVKPPVSYGSRGFRVLRENTAWSVRRFMSEKPNAIEITLDELSKILSRDKNVDFPELLVMEYLPGSEYSVDAFLGKKMSVAIPRLRKEIVNGISFRTSLEYRRDIMDYTIEAATEIGLKYAFGFQFKLDYQDAPKVLECNPRVQGTMVASVFSGANVIWMSLREAIGEPVEKLPPILQDSEYYRFWGGGAVTGSQFREI
ncbi:MAG: ATP-grasp domain-containing protein [Thaumarchaeota archaeon]|nr:ATP-grasp domain-containing protein [Nitrososphaerota archaeon]